MLAEHHSYTREIQEEKNFQQLRLQKLMAEGDINDVEKGLTSLVKKVEELSPQFHPELKIEKHKSNYSSDAVPDFWE